MAENIKVNPSGQPNAVTVATDVVGNVHYPIYKLAFSTGGELPVDVTDTTPLPVGLRNSDGSLLGDLANPVFVDPVTRLDDQSVMVSVLAELKLTRLHLEEITEEDFHDQKIED